MCIGTQCPPKQGAENIPANELCYFAVHRQHPCSWYAQEHEDLISAWPTIRPVGAVIGDLWAGVASEMLDRPMSEGAPHAT